LGGFTAWRIALSTRSSSGPQFRQATFRRGVLDDARYTPDGQNILYTAAFEGGENEIYTVAAKAMGGHSLGMGNARLLAISSRGELAIALTPHNVTTLLSPGNLARTFGENGAPKAEIENVQAADFTPDGSAMAIVRWVPGDYMCQVEYPIGKILYRQHAINDLRFSPDGKYLAFITHESPYDDRGPLTILRSTGEKVVTSPTFASAHGLAWSPSGDEVWMTSPLETGEIHAVGLSGKIRVPLTVPGRLRLMDIAANGQLLVAQGITRRGMVVSGQDGKIERDLSWLDFTYGRAISGDGKMILFEEEGNQSQGYTVFVRDVDGSAAVPIGEGYGMAISPDKNWALAQKLAEPNNEVWLLPVGPGEARRISPPNLSPMGNASFLSDGKRIVYVAREGAKQPRTWIQDLNGGSPRPITEEGWSGWRVSPDDKMLLVGSASLSPRRIEPVLVPIAGGPPQKITGLQTDDDVLGWSADGQIYVEATAKDTSVERHVEKLNPRNGVRSAWRDLAKPTIGGVFPQQPVITPDGSSYFYPYRLSLSDLYTVNGVH
jgi:eukaryotic-like serine/threonine-protein kinase